MALKVSTLLTTLVFLPASSSCFGVVTLPAPGYVFEEMKLDMGFLQNVINKFI